MRTFEAFSQIMSNLPYWGEMDESRRNRLLRDLYEVALGKCVMEAIAKGLRDEVPEVRGKRRQALKAVRLLREAQQAVEEARASCGDALAACEEKSKSAGENFTFAVMATNLNFSVALLNKHAAAYAAFIHPKLRTPAEKPVATKFIAAMKDFPLKKAHELPSGKKAEMLDAWFMHRAAECIDRYKSKTRTIEGRDVIIAKLFDAAFSEFRSPGSVQKALQQTRRSKQQYLPPVKIEFVRSYANE
jgi:hypothetical protein